MKRRKQNRWRTIGVAALTLLAVAYIGYQGFRSVFSGVETELAVEHSVFESIDATGLVFRSEQVISSTKKGHPYFTVENGTRVSKGSVIASVYNDMNSGHIEQEIVEIDAQIEALNNIRKDAGSNRLTLDIVKGQISDALYTMVMNTETGNLQETGTSQFELLTLLSKEQLIVGKTVDFDKKIAELKERRKELKKQYQKPIAGSDIKAKDAGYFVNATDGFETKVDEKSVCSMTVSDLRKQMEKKPQPNAKACGKIVSGYQWYMACVLPDSYYGELNNHLNQSGKISLRMSFVLDEAVPVTVISCKKDTEAKGYISVVFRCDYMSAELSTIRKEAVQIQIKEHTGLKVPKRAIVIDKNQQAGVYVRVGNVASFKKIKQVYSEPADYVICEEVNEDGYLRMYDDIITEGRDLYDGKIVA